jgi:hypothetical protein
VDSAALELVNVGLGQCECHGTPLEKGPIFDGYGRWPFVP